jgi:hypothetical protein
MSSMIGFAMTRSATGERSGVNLGTLAIRGERGVLVTSLDALVHVPWNPFFSSLPELIREGVVEPFGR